VRSLSPVTGPGERSLNYAKPGSDEGPPRSSCTGEVQTLKEALTYIHRLHKSGRMEDLAALLRQKQVFREAWLILQQSSITGSATSKRVKVSSCRIKTAGSGNFPSPPNQELNPEPEPAKSGEAVEPEFTSATAIQAAANTCLNSASRPRYTLAAALQVYKIHLSYYAQEKDPPLRVSIRV
jgi:hypothetical protein